MVVVVRVRDIGGLAVIEFDFEPVGFGSRVIDAVEIVQAAIGRAGHGGSSHAKCHCEEDGGVLHGARPSIALDRGQSVSFRNFV